MGNTSTKRTMENQENQENQKNKRIREYETNQEDDFKQEENILGKRNITQSYEEIQYINTELSKRKKRVNLLSNKTNITRELMRLQQPIKPIEYEIMNFPTFDEFISNSNNSEFIMKFINECNERTNNLETYIEGTPEYKICKMEIYLCALIKEIFIDIELKKKLNTSENIKIIDNLINNLILRYNTDRNLYYNILNRLNKQKAGKSKKIKINKSNKFKKKTYNKKSYNKKLYNKK